MTYEGPLLAITGPTASGKTRKAVAAASLLEGEIISADSRQVYVGMDLGTGKDLQDYIYNGKQIPYHLIDIRPAGYHYNLQEFLSDFDKAQQLIRKKGKLPVICGGTGMYVETALSGVRMQTIPPNPELRRKLKDKSLPELTAMLASLKKLHNTTDTDTRERALRGLEIETYYQSHPEENEKRDRKKIKPREHLLIALSIERQERRRRISDRLTKRFSEGMTQEVESLLAQGVPPENLIYYGLEYKFITLYVTGAIDEAEMHRNLEIAIHQFAKRQMTWLRGMERRGFKIYWMPAETPDDEFAQSVAERLATYEKEDYPL